MTPTPSALSSAGRASSSPRRAEPPPRPPPSRRTPTGWRALAEAEYGRARGQAATGGVVRGRGHVGAARATAARGLLPLAPGRGARPRPAADATGPLREAHAVAARIGARPAAAGAGAARRPRAARARSRLIGAEDELTRRSCQDEPTTAGGPARTLIGRRRPPSQSAMRSLSPASCSSAIRTVPAGWRTGTRPGNGVPCAHSMKNGSDGSAAACSSPASRQRRTSPLRVSASRRGS